MEQNRISSSSQHGSHEVRSQRAAKGQASQDSVAATPAQGDGFALLLAALGGVQCEAQAMLDVAQASVPIQDAIEFANDAGVRAAIAGASLTASFDAAASLDTGLGLMRPGHDTLVGQTAMLDGAAESAALNGTPRAFGAAGRVRAPGQSWTQLALQATDAGANARQATGPGGVPLTTALQSAVAQVQAQMQSVANGAAGVLPQALATDPPRGAPLLVQPEPAMTGAQLAAGGVGVSGGRIAEMGGAQRSDGGAGGAMGGDAMQPGPDVVGDVGATEAAAQPGADDLQEQIAERVAYWVHQKSQSAELKLDRDGQSVEVSVMLKGDEAHVSFRSDHADARHWLDNSSAELRTLLQREGLQLAGMSVGTTSDGAAGSQRGETEGGARGRQRHAQVQAVASPSAAGEGRAGQVGERSVDLFV